MVVLVSSKCVVNLIFVILLIALSNDFVESIIKRCFNCRSRGELGTCKDEFEYQNVTLLNSESGVEAVPCASGWCGKVIETSEHDSKIEEYGTATQRMCLQRIPSDNEERCDNTVRGYKKVFMCFCRGDLCNSTSRLQLSTITIILCCCYYVIINYVVSL